MISKNLGTCEFCDRERYLTFHHLIPKTLHTNKWFTKNFDKNDMRTRGLMLCKDCHSNVHRFIDEKDLGKYFNTKELLLSNDLVKNFVEWIKKR